MKTGVEKSLRIHNGRKEKRSMATGGGRKVALAVLACFAGMLFATGCGARMQRYEALDTAMGTVIRQSIYTREKDITAEVENIIETLEKSELSWRLPDTEVAKINAAAGNGETVMVSDKLYEDLTILLEVSRKSGGAFDFTVGPVVQLWNIDEWAAGEQADAVIPDKEKIAQALQNTGYEKVLMENGGVSLSEGMSLDLGAAGKGLACDRIAVFLEEKEV